MVSEKGRMLSNTENSKGISDTLSLNDASVTEGVKRMMKTEKVYQSKRNYSKTHLTIQPKIKDTIITDYD